jgi:hypothetical protein
LLPAAARNSREAAAAVNTLSASLPGILQQQQQQQQQYPNNNMLLVTQQSAQLLAGLLASEVVPLFRAELGSSLGPWLADSSAALKRLDTRLAVGGSSSSSSW